MTKTCKNCKNNIDGFCSVTEHYRLINDPDGGRKPICIFVMPPPLDESDTCGKHEDETK